MDSDQLDFSVLLTLLATIISSAIDEASNSLVFRVLKFVMPMISLVLAIHKWRTRKPFIKDFFQDDWRVKEDGFEISVPRKKHKKGRNSTIQIYRKSGDQFQLSEPIIKQDLDGNFAFSGLNNFNGRYEVR